MDGHITCGIARNPSFDWRPESTGASCATAASGAATHCKRTDARPSRRSGNQSRAAKAGNSAASADPNVKPGSEADVNSIGDRNVGKGLDFYSLEKEIALGKQLAQEVDKSAKFIDDPVVNEYVNRVGQNLVRNSDVRAFPSRLK